MLVFNCTKAALNFFSYTKDKIKYSPVEATPNYALDDMGSKKHPLSQWLLQCVKIQHHNVLFACHIKYRYVMFFNNIEKNNWQGFIDTFNERYIAQITQLLEDYEVGIKLSDDILTAIKKHHHPTHCFARYCPKAQHNITLAVEEVTIALDQMGWHQVINDEADFEAAYNDYLTSSTSMPDVFIPRLELLLDFLVNVTKLDPQMAAKKREQWLNSQPSVHWNDIEFDAPDFQDFQFLGEQIKEEINRIIEETVQNSKELPSNVIDINQARKARKKK